MTRATRNTWFAEHLSDQGVYVQYLDDHHPVHMPCLEIRRLDWAHAAKEAKRLEMRFVAVWAADRAADANKMSGKENSKRVLCTYMAFAHPEHRHVILRTELSAEKPEIPSISSHYIAAFRMERSMQDMFGLSVSNALDNRLWIKHEHWPADAHALLHDFDGDTPLQPDPERADVDYDYVACDSECVYEIPVGPVHAGIIEPGHFRFLAVGEQVLNMEERLGYVHKGIERSMQGRTAPDGIVLAGRVSGDATVAHAWAFAQACEYAANLDIPSRASYVRGILCERERIANHIGDIGAVCNDAAFAFMHGQCLRLREDMARLNQQAFGHRLLMDSVIVGGVAADLSSDMRQRLIQQTLGIAAEVEHLRAIYADAPSIQQRVIGAGIVSVEDAKDLGLLGFVGRASGHYADERIEEAYPPYDDLIVPVPKGKLGGVSTRVWVRFEEIANASRMVIQMLETLPDGEINTSWQAPEAGVSGFAAIESWRGEIAAWVRFGEEGTIDRYFVRDPSVINWLGLELAARTVPVPDFPLVNKSFNCSYSGNDL
ncbi:NADH-quinone oxidoreductase subunit C [Mariprofundus ferrooxydans]|nr:NADH-quinone oxidoreductase subunit C [Mariprofundus ferrooxydans]